MNNPKKITIMQLLFPAAYAVLFYFFGEPGGAEPLISTVFFLAGMYIGEGLLKLDKIWLYKYYLSQPESRLAEKNLITRSVLFALSLIPLSIFLITSTGSSLGVGVLFGIVAGLAIEMFAYRKDSGDFQERFLFQVNKTLRPKDIDWYFRIFIIFSVVLSILIIL